MAGDVGGVVAQDLGFAAGGVVLGQLRDGREQAGAEAVVKVFGIDACRAGEQAGLQFLEGLRGIVGRGFQEGGRRSEEHTSELQAPIRLSYAVLCSKKKRNKHKPKTK